MMVGSPFLLARRFEMDNNSRIRSAARGALETHAALKATRIVEPVSDEDGVPIDPDAWQHWYDTMAKPAYTRWDEAMNELAQALGEPDMSRHPFNFQPRCEAILADDVAAVRER